MRKEKSSSLAGIIGIIIFLILGSGFYHLIQRQIRASDWDKFNILSCTKLNSKEVFCKQKYSALFGFFPKNTEFKLLAANIQKHEGGEYPDEYVLHIKTDDNGVIEINDYGDDHKRAYKTQKLLRDLLRETEMSTVKIKYSDGIIKNLSVGFLGLLVVLCGGHFFNSQLFKKKCKGDV